MTDIEEIESKVCRIIGEIIPDQIGKIAPEARFREDLEADSLDLIEILMTLEEKFGKDISDEDARYITTVGAAILFIYEHIDKREGTE